MHCLRLPLSRALFIRSKILTVPSAKYASQHPMKFLEVQDRWRLKDNVSKKWQLIYKAPMDNILNYMSVYLTFSTTTIGCSGLYFALFRYDPKTVNDPVLLGDSIVIANSAIECLTYLGAFVLLHIAVKVLLSKYVVRLYQDGDKYLAIYRGHLYNSIIKYEFHLNDFRRLKPTYIVTWGNARFSLGKKHAIILENYFKTPEHFNRLLNKKGADNPYKD